MLLEVVVGAVLSLLILVGLVALVLKRAPSALVADRFPERFYGQSDDVDELGPDFSVDDYVDSTGGQVDHEDLDASEFDLDRQRDSGRN